MRFTDITRGPDFCPKCGEYVKWIRLISGMWIAVNEQPVLYVPGAGKMWLVEYVKWDATILKDCLIYRPGLEIDLSEPLAKGYEPHVFSHGKE